MTGTHALSLPTALPSDMNQYTGPLEQIYILTINIPGDDIIFLKFPISSSELIKAILHLQKAAIYLKNSFHWRTPWILFRVSVWGAINASLSSHVEFYNSSC